MLVKFTSYPFDIRICVITTLRMYSTQLAQDANMVTIRHCSLVHQVSFQKNNYVQAWINVELFQHQYQCCSHIQSKCILFLQNRFCQHLCGVQPPHFVSFSTNLLMLIMILQKMFEISRLGYCRAIDALQTKCCVAEYGFCIEFVICVQCALKTFHVRPQCGDGIEFKN